MALIGLLAATIGSLAGLGGGFIVAPLLRVVYALPPEQAAATSLVLVFANVASASAAFLRQRRVDVKLGLLMGAFAIPGSVAGALLVRLSPAAWFDYAYAALLAIVALDMIARGGKRAHGGSARLWWGRARIFEDRLSGADFRYTESPPIAAAAGLVMGFVSSFFGIGGGIITLPVLFSVFAMPAHISAATSHLVILLSVPIGVATHVYEGNVVWADALPLAIGGVAGGQAGAALSKRLSGPTLVRILAVVLLAGAATLALSQLGALGPHSSR